MDYMTELASHPDIAEALDALAGEWQGARWLLGKVPPPEPPGVGFLRDKYPNAWLAEVIHEFYREPRLAAEVWKELRYCRRSRESLESLMRASATAWQFKPARPRTETVQDADVLKAYQRDASPSDAANAPSREAIRSHVEKHSAAVGHWHEPPQFIAGLIKAELAAKAGWYSRVTEKYWLEMRASSEVRQRAYELLSNRDEVKRVADETGIPVPFSMVLQAELDQIRQTRKYVCDTPHGPRMTATLREPVIGETSFDGAPTRQALREDLVGLAFSGGGIRSATFNLGILQWLAAHRSAETLRLPVDGIRRRLHRQLVCRVDVQAVS